MHRLLKALRHEVPEVSAAAARLGVKPGGDAIVRSAGRVSGLTGFGQFIFSMPGQLILFFGTLGLVFAIGWMINRLSAATALMMFMAYAALVGVMLSSILLRATPPARP